MKLLVFGDSVARGTFDAEKGGWVERLKAHFLEEYLETNIGVYNCSVSSNDSRGVLAFMENDIKKIISIENEKLAIMIAVGTNDPRYIDADICVNNEEFKRNMHDIIKISKRYTEVIFIVGGFPIDESRVNPWYNHEWYYNKDLEEYTHIMEQIAQQHAVIFIDLRNILLISDLSDGLHPNSTGHEKIFQVVKSHIEGIGIG